MRLTFIFAVIIAATLHASGTAVTTTKDSKTTIENVVATGTVDRARKDEGRLLRRVEKLAAEEEERVGFGKFLQKEFLKSIPFTKTRKQHKSMDRFRKEAARRQKLRDDINDAMIRV
ncbi:RxLR effector protein [Phytophthora megakarya]|uniref:RxLR effector protein n=1 Tax=Phytophthora megakarya TaxID=4795 RepID=A0A225V2L4_9STRA|nr:RxLR effector protein [Phytophthora megakarya]